jgi:adenylosuccinate synthase
LIGSGVVVNLQSLLNEINNITQMGIKIDSSNLFISDNATIIIEDYKKVDSFFEQNLAENKIGTTKKGIGIAYGDRASRRAIRICDIFHDQTLLGKITKIAEFYNPILSQISQKIDPKEVFDYLISIREQIRPYVVSVYKFASNFSGSVMFEGAQGFGLDTCFGTYPFVTSSSTVSGAIFTGSGFGLCNINKNLGVLKAYSTRVGDGVFPTEGSSDFETKLQEIGNEFGTVTKRKRRCGALDLVYAKQSAFLNGSNEVALTKIDVLDGFDKIPVCIGYKIKDQVYDYLPSSIEDSNQIQPIYKIFEGWSKQGKTAGATTYDKLPENAKIYIKFIENFINCKITIISTGKERGDTIIL